MAATFLQRSRHKSIYYFRRKVPLDLRAVVGASAGKVTTPNLSYFHSHRHTLAAELAKQGVTEEVRAAIAGQEYGGINNELYNKLKDSPATLAPLIERHLTIYAELLDEVMAAK